MLILANLDHPNIVRLHESYEDTKKYYLITEYYSGGDLQKKLNIKKKFKEKEVAEYMT